MIVSETEMPQEASQSAGCEFSRETLKKKTLIWCAYFAILLCCALPQGLNTPVTAVGFTTTGAQEIPRMAKLADVVNLYGDGDAGIYARMATHLGRGQFTEYEYWRLRLFAPGNAFTEAACLRMFGPDFPIVLFFTVLTCAFWACVLFNVRALGNYPQRPVLCFLIPLSLCCLGLFERHLLNRGVVLSETLSIAQLSLGFLYTLRAIRENHWAYAVWGGVFLALAAYMRAQNEVVCDFLSKGGLLFTAVIFAWYFLERAAKKRHNSVKSVLKAWPALTFILVALLVFNALTAPYRCWNLYQYKSTNWLQWDHYWEANWRDENLMRTRDHDDALIDAGETVAARVNPELATYIQKEVNAKGPFAFPDEYYKRSSIMTFLTHPFHWTVLKFPAARKAWRDGTTDFQIPGPLSQLHLEFVLYLGTLVFCLVRSLGVSLARKLKGEELWNFLFFGALFSANAATTIFIHLEARYFYTLKIVSFVLFLCFALIKSTFTMKLSGFEKSQ
ncbi:MAG: hypothetical protein P4L53_27150 [Candidatus Obscuribacterales bacterium]|nr:hypothetical protein [Candidatus Obscuribacterales bacterium]